MKLAIAFGLFPLLSMTACVSLQDDVKTKAAFDFKCDKEKIAVTETGYASFGAEGCGKRARYQCNENGFCFKNSETEKK